MNKIGRLILATVLAASICATPVFAEENIDTLRQQKATAEAEVDGLEAELTELLGNIAQLEQDLISKGQEIDTAHTELKQEEAKEKAQYAAMKLRIKFMYESGKASLANAVLSASDMSDALNKAEYAAQISTYDRNMIDSYIETENQIKALKTALETQQSEMVALQNDYNVQQENLNEMIETKQAEVADFSERLDAAIAAAAAKAAAERAAAEAAARQTAKQTAGGSQSTYSHQASSSSVNAYSENNDYNDYGDYNDYSDYNDTSEEYNDYEEYEEEESSSGTYCGYNANTGNIIVDTAYTQLGVPYVWGGTTPYVGLDCSGLVQYCYRCAGIYIPRTSSEMAAEGIEVSDPQPGDICWTPGHVAIYIGGGQMIEAQQTGVPVKVSSVRVSRYLRFY